MQSNIESNQKLIERFPFLIPRNRWTGKVPEDYDYSYTELDSMPDGWRKAFGEQMCEDIREELVRAEYLDQYRITQIKEKYGTLRWYDFGCTERMLRDIIPKYEHLSARICIRCGNPATKVSIGWISPYCDTCAGKISHAERFIPIEVWLSGSGDAVASERIISNGWCLTANTSESPNSEDGCILSDILIRDVPERYFLSAAAMRKILSNLSRDRRAKESTKQTE